VVALLGVASAAFAARVYLWNLWEASTGRRPLLAVDSWHYQLDKIEPMLPQIQRNTADLLVVDHAKRDGKVAFTPAEVERLTVRRDGRRRLVVSYMSIGEAEAFRVYWKPEWKTAPPDWLGHENCAWPQAHRVRFWLDSWKEISFRGPGSFLKRIVDAGFDGVYLDRADIYETFEKERPEARAEMIAFVTELARTARRLKPGFLVIVQNAEDLLTDADYRWVVDAVAKESMLYSGAGGTGVRNKAEDIGWSMGRLKLLMAERKPVLSVEYLTDIDAIDAARHELIRQGFVPTFPTRSLDGDEPTLPRDIASEVGTPERTKAMCPPGSSW
jgi:cysteinyl-tRNA synthetase